MCGIAGVFIKGRIGNWKNSIEAIIEDQKSRGPDFQSVESGENSNFSWVLGHDRLSILDLSSDSNQPFWDEERRFGIVFNGEIYNYQEIRTELLKLGHQFHTTGDTEVLLRAFKEWGQDSVEKFIGMFAFAILDTKEARLLIFRDRFGVKPCFYHIGRDAIVFASTTRQLARELNLNPNLEYVSRGLQYWVWEDSTDISPYYEMKALRSGECLDVSLTGNGELQYKLRRYYDLKDRVRRLRPELEKLGQKDFLSMVMSILNSAVDYRLRSDVPVGVSLSGGLDSSTVTALMIKRASEPTGFTFAHPTSKQSEGPIIAQLSKYLNVKVEYIWPEIDEMIEGFWETLEAQDAPFSGAHIMAQNLVYKRARSLGVKVLLGGQGADEAFMGYRKFQFFRLMELFRRKNPLKLGSFAIQMFPLILAELPSAPGYLRASKRYSKGSGIDVPLNLPKAEAVSMRLIKGQELWERQAHDVLDFSLPTLLRYEDRNSMGHSVESRLPFMDHRLIELGLALPAEAKVRNGFGKWILRQGMEGMLPNSIRIARYKKGFDVPQHQWIRSGLGATVRDRLRRNKDAIASFLPEGSKNIDEIFSDDQLVGRPNAFIEAISLSWLSMRTN